MNRAERRRQQKEKAKVAERYQKVAPWMPADQVRNKVDFAYDRVSAMYEKDMKSMQDALSQICADELLKAEQYMMVGLVMISLKSLELTFGNLKTVQKGMDKFLQNFGKATDYVDSTGIMATYRDLQDKYGLGDLGFEDFEYPMDGIERIWQNNEQKVSQLLWSVWDKRRMEIDKLGDEVEKVR